MNGFPACKLLHFKISNIVYSFFVDEFECPSYYYSDHLVLKWTNFEMSRSNGKMAVIMFRLTLSD